MKEREPLVLDPFAAVMLLDDRMKCNPGKLEERQVRTEILLN